MSELVFHIGHHKTATTWLQTKFFDSHPDIELLSNFNAPWDDEFISYLIGTSERKFDNNLCSSLLKSDKRLVSREDGVSVVSAERLSGHPFSGGYDSYLIANRIFTCFPEAKIILVIRNQVDMLTSMYKQLVRGGYLGTFSDLIHGYHWKGVGFSLDFLEYDLLISKYHSLFGKEHVLVLLYEDLKIDQRKYVRKISTFLGVDEFYETSNDKGAVNVSLPEKQISAKRLLNHCRKTEYNPFPIVSIDTSNLDRWSRLLSLFFSSNIFDDKDIEFVRGYYTESNSRLKIILDRELPGYS